MKAKKRNPKKKQPKHAPVTALVLNYNGTERALECLRSFAQQTIPPACIVVIDNASQDFDEAAMRKALGPRYSNSRFLRLPENIGYAKGMNRGLRQILEDTDAPDWVLTLNNDTKLEPDFFEKLEAAVSDLDASAFVGMLAPKVKAMDRPEMLDATGIGICLDGMSTARGQRERDEHQYDAKTEILVPNGVAALYHLDVLRDVGLFDEDFWAYCEDTDLGLRAWLAGWECRFVPECVVYHARSSSHGEFSLDKLYYTERNHYWVALKNLPLPLLALNPPLTLYRYALQAYAVFSDRGQGRAYSGNFSSLELAKTTLRALADAGRGAPRALKLRIEARVLRRRSLLTTLFTLWKKRLSLSELILK